MKFILFEVRGNLALFSPSDQLSDYLDYWFGGVFLGFVVAVITAILV